MGSRSEPQTSQPGLLSVISRSSIEWVTERARLTQQRARAREFVRTSSELVKALDLSPSTDQSVVAISLRPRPQQLNSRESQLSKRAADEGLGQHKDGREASRQDLQEATCPDRNPNTSKANGAHNLADTPGKRERNLQEPSFVESPSGRGQVKRQRKAHEEPVLYCVAARGLSTNSAESVAEVVRTVQPKAVVLVLAPHEHHLLGLIHSCSSGSMGVPPPVALLKNLHPPQQQTPLSPHAQLERIESSHSANTARLSQQSLSSRQSLEPGLIPTSAGAVVAFAAEHRVSSAALFHVWSALHFLRALTGAHPLSHLAAAAREAQELGTPVLALPALDDNSLLQGYGFGYRVQGTEGTGSDVPANASAACQLSNKGESDHLETLKGQAEESSSVSTGEVTHEGIQPSIRAGLVMEQSAAPSTDRQHVNTQLRSTVGNARDLASAWAHPPSWALPPLPSQQQHQVSGNASSLAHPRCPGHLAQEIAGEFMALFEASSEGESENSGAELEVFESWSTVGAGAQHCARAILKKALSLSSETEMAAEQEGFREAFQEYSTAANTARELELQSLREGWVPEMGGGLGDGLLTALCSWAGLTTDTGRDRGRGNVESTDLEGRGKTTGGVGMLASGLQGLLQEGISLPGAGPLDSDRTISLEKEGLHPAAGTRDGQESEAKSEGAGREGLSGGPVVVVMSAATLNQVGREWCQGDASRDQQLVARNLLLSASFSLVPAMVSSASDVVLNKGSAASSESASTAPGWIFRVQHRMHQACSLGWARLFPSSSIGSSHDSALCSLSPALIPFPRASIQPLWQRPHKEATAQPQNSLILLGEGTALLVSGVTALAVAVSSKAATWASAGWVIKLGGAKAVSSMRMAFTLLRSWPHALMAAKALSASTGASSTSVFTAALSKLLSLSPLKWKGAMVYSLSKGGLAKGAVFKGATVSKAGGVWSVKGGGLALGSGGTATGSGVATGSTSALASSAVTGPASATGSVSSVAASAMSTAAATPSAGAAATSSSSAGLGSSAVSAAGGWVRQSAQHKVQQVAWRMLGTLLDQRLRSSLGRSTRDTTPAHVTHSNNPYSSHLQLFPSFANAKSFKQQQEGGRLRNFGRTGVGLGGVVLAGGCLWSVVDSAPASHPWLGPLHCALAVASSANEVANLGKGVVVLRSWESQGG